MLCCLQHKPVCECRHSLRVGLLHHHVDHRPPQSSGETDSNLCIFLYHDWLFCKMNVTQKWLHIWYAAACTCNTCLKLILSWEKLTCKGAWTLNPENLCKSLMKGMNIIWYLYTKLQKFVSELSAWYYFPYYRWCTRWQRSNILRWIGALMIARTCQGNTCLLSMMRLQGMKSRWRL